MRLQIAAQRASLFAVLLILAACGSTGPDRPGPAALMYVVSGDAQAGTVATNLAQPLVVRVTDSQSRPVQGALVQWSITTGTGILTPSSSSTDANGNTQTTYTLGTLAGANQVTASISGVTSTALFSATSKPGALYKVLATQHTLALCQPGDQGAPGASATDQFGNTVDSAVTWVSRNPSVATVTSSGTVQLVSATGATWVVASSGSAQPDSVYVTAAPPITLAAGQVDDTLPSSAFCVQSNQLGSEYVLAAFFNTTAQGSSTQIVVTGSRLGVLGSGLNVVPLSRIAPAPSLQPFMPLHPDYAFEHALRERERREMPKYVSAARAWEANRRRQGPALSVSSGTLSTTSTSTVAGTTAAASPTPSFSQVTTNTKVGDLVQFNTNANAYCSSPIMSTGRVAAISNSAIVVADTSNPTGGFTDAEYMNFAVAMDTLVDPVDTTAFGAPYDIDGTNKVIILFTKAVNQLTTDPTLGIVLGFYYSRDLLPVASCAGSNHANMFYLVVPDPNRTINGGNTFTANKQNVANIVVSTIGHEYQHLINASRRMYVNNAPITDEVTWLNEGLSHIAEELIFYRSSGLSPRQDIGTAALSTPAAWNAFQLFMWGNQGRYEQYLPATETNGPLGEYSGDDALATRGAIWSFLRYAADQLGSTDGTFWYRLVNSQTVGLPNLQAAMGTDPTPYFRSWATSVVTDDAVPGINPLYTQPSWNWPQVYARVGNVAYPTPLSHVLSTGTSVTTTLDAEGVGFYRFAVNNGQQGLIAVTGLGGTSIPSTVRLTLVRTK
ncbi:MAG TPA: Ig-like domain-containing protein [Gemmatimonadaceae bacterium]